MLTENGIFARNIRHKLCDSSDSARGAQVGSEAIGAVDGESHGDIRILGDAGSPVDIGDENPDLVTFVHPDLPGNIAITEGLDVDLLHPVDFPDAGLGRGFRHIKYPCLGPVGRLDHRR